MKKLSLALASVAVAAVPMLATVPAADAATTTHDTANRCWKRGTMWMCVESTDPTAQVAGLSQAAEFLPWPEIPRLPNPWPGCHWVNGRLLCTYGF